jgi:hypothetical protein
MECKPKRKMAATLCFGPPSRTPAGRALHCIVAPSLFGLERSPIMPMITLSAHYDGRQIRLDEAYDLKPGTKLFVTVLSEPELDNAHEGWMNLAAAGLTDAYGKGEPEYSPDMLKKVNPEYEGR